jgi:hypothetical protein
MSAETKRREILQMLAKGSIDAREASEMLEQVVAEKAADESAALPTSEPPEPPAQSQAPPSAPEPVAARPGNLRWLNVRVTDSASGRKRVSVKIPLSLARIGLRVGAKFVPEMDEMDWEQVLSEISSGDVGTIIEVNDEQSGEQVQVFVS